MLSLDLVQGYSASLNEKVEGQREMNSVLYILKALCTSLEYLLLNNFWQKRKNNK